MFLTALDWESRTSPCGILRIDATTNDLPDGAVIYVPAIPGFSDANPQMGSNLGNNSTDCVVVFERKPSWTSQVEIMAVRIEAATGVFRAPITIANANTQVNNLRPAVSKDANGFGWVIAWESVSTRTSTRSGWC